MAQTRAVGKAYRLLCGWLMKAAGFEATTYEEAESMPSDTPPETPVKTSGKDIADAILNKITPQMAAKLKKQLVNIRQDEDGVEMCIDLNIGSISNMPVSKWAEAQEWIKNHQKGEK